MDRKQRVDAALTGTPVDRLPVSIWGHDFLREWSAQDLARQTIENQRAYGYDFVKINPCWTLFAEPWDNRYEPPTEQRFPRLLERRVGSAPDLDAVADIKVDSAPLDEHVDAVAQITAALGDDCYCIATLFSPLAVLGLLCGGVGKPLTEFALQNPRGTQRALEAITPVLSAHAQALRAAGAAGLFYAPLQWTSLDFCDADFYAEFGAPFDRDVLAAVTDAPFNLLHVCGNHIGIDRFYDYPVQALSWDNFGPGNPSLREVLGASDKAVAGGIPHRLLHKLDARGP